MSRRCGQGLRPPNGPRLPSTWSSEGAPVLGAARPAPRRQLAARARPRAPGPAEAPTTAEETAAADPPTAAGADESWADGAGSDKWDDGVQRPCLTGSRVLLVVRLLPGGSLAAAPTRCPFPFLRSQRDFRFPELPLKTCYIARVTLTEVH